MRTLGVALLLLFLAACVGGCSPSIGVGMHLENDDGLRVRPDMHVGLYGRYP